MLKTLRHELPGRSWRRARLLVPSALLASLVIFSMLSLTCGKTTTYRTFTLSGKAETGARTASRAALSLGRVQIVAPFFTGWQRYGNQPKSDLPNQATTGTDGTYTMLIDYDLFLALSADSTVYIAAADKAGTFTMVSPIGPDLVTENAKVTININPATTAVGIAYCPSGTRPAPSGSYCFPGTGIAPQMSVQNSSTNTKNLLATFGAIMDADASFDSLPPRWDALVGGVLAKGTALSQLLTIATGLGISASSITVPAITGVAVGPAVFAIDSATNTKEDTGSDSSSSCDDSNHSSKTCPSGAKKCCFTAWSCCRSAFDGAEGCNPTSFCE